MELGEFGVWVARSIAPEDLPEAGIVAEELGFGTFWLGGSPRLPVLKPLLAATERIKVATGIVNVWQYEPQALAAEFWELEDATPGRLLLGVGIGHPEATGEYHTPLAKMRSFFDGLAAAKRSVPRERMIAAALGPRMLDLSFERSLGTHPYFVPPEHTSFARERLGPDALIAPELAVVLDDDRERARAVATEYASRYLGLTNYVSNLRRFDYTDADLTPDSPKLLDAIVPQGSAAALAEHARAHLQAGADHVCVQALGVEGVPRAQWTALAGALIA